MRNLKKIPTIVLVLSLLTAGSILFAADSSEAQSLDAGSEEECLYDPASFYCLHDWDDWGSMAPIHISRIAIVDDGLFPGFSFQLEQLSGLPTEMGYYESEPPYNYVRGSSNGMNFWRPQYGYTEARVTVGGLDATLFFTGGCGFSICYWGLHSLALGDGWVGENGFDFSGEVFVFGPEDENIYVEGWGSSQPFWPWDEASWGPGADPQYAIATFGPVIPTASHQVEDFFGIRVEVDMDMEEQPYFLPEPASGSLLAAGVLGMVGLARRRQRLA